MRMGLCRMRQSGYFAYIVDPSPERVGGGNRLRKGRFALSTGGRPKEQLKRAAQWYPSDCNSSHRAGLDSQERNDGRFGRHLLRAHSTSRCPIGLPCRSNHDGALGASRQRPCARHGALGPQRLADPLRHAARRPGRAMRADPKRHRGGSAQYRADRDHPEDRRQEEPGSCG